MPLNATGIGPKGVKMNLPWRSCLSDFTEDGNSEVLPRTARSISYKTHTPTSPRLSNSISQWGADATEMNCGVCKVKFSWATNVIDAHVAASASRPTGSVFTRRRAGTSSLFVSSCYMTFLDSYGKSNDFNKYRRLRWLWHYVRLKWKG